MTDVIGIPPTLGKNGESRRIEAPDQAASMTRRVFSASGRGAQGTITEWRMGLRGRIVLDIDLDEPIRDVWIFEGESCCTDGYQIILSFPYSSTVLRLSEDLLQVAAIDTDKTPFQTSSRTIFAASLSDDIAIQVTETSLTVVTPGNRYVALQTLKFFLVKN